MTYTTSCILMTKELLSVADPGISKREVAVVARGLRIALKPPVGQRQSRGGGPGGEAPGS
jgi:hypothetical protein